MTKRFKPNSWTDGMMGLVTGDALGVPVQFMERDEIRQRPEGPVAGMESGGVYQMPAGTWSDDSSMALATLESIRRKGGIDPGDIMLNFVKWMFGGEFTPFGEAFDEGNTCVMAITKFFETADWQHAGRTGEYANGNGALMRILPFSLYCIFRGRDKEKTVGIINTATAITHGHPISQMGSLIFTLFLEELMRTDSVSSAWENTRAFNYSAYYESVALDAYKILLSDEFMTAGENAIGETGYVVDSLMAAVYSILGGKTFEDTILTAINLGYDTDTNAAITGALAGAFYGIESIPERWLNAMRRLDYLEDVAERFAGVMIM